MNFVAYRAGSVKDLQIFSQPNGTRQEKRHFKGLYHHLQYDMGEAFLKYCLGWSQMQLFFYEGDMS